MGLQVPQLSELLVAAVKLAQKRLCRGVYDLMCTYIPMLRERFEANVAVVRSFARVSSFMRLQIAKLAESLTTVRLLAQEWLDSRMRSCVNFEMRLLVERFPTTWYVTEILLLRPVWIW